MGQIVIIDGPRGSGKSSTCQLIVDQLVRQGTPAEYFKKGQRVAPSDYQNMLDHLATFRRRREVMVVDRFVATEWVMSTAHQRLAPRQLMTECIDVDQQLSQLNAIHVILLPSLQTLAYRLAERGPDGRTWDMEQALIHPLWRTAHAFMCSSAIVANETPRDQHVLVTSLVHLINLKLERQHAE